MKKFYNKISHPQWRVTVPNINTSLFRKSPIGGKISPKRSSGSYDFEEAQKEFDRASSLPTSIYVNESDCNSSNSSDSEDDMFEDARGASDKNSNVDIAKEIDDSELYVDLTTSTPKKVVKSKNLDENNAQYEYDVPKISFQFFEKKQNVDELDHEIDEITYEVPKSPSLTVKKSEITVELDSPCDDQNSSYPPNNVKSENLEIYPVMGIIKCGSDPNLTLRRRSSNDDDENDDNLYKVPRKLGGRNRLSQSLHDFDVEMMMVSTTITTSNQSSIEHISCSQVLVQNSPQQSTNNNNNSHPVAGCSNNSESMDYCKARSKLPLKLRRPTFLRKPKKAIDTWNNFRSKLNNMMSEQAAQQRVGAYVDREKVVLNLEEMYKNSKTKCRNALKIFNRKDSNNSESSSQIVKNDAFFSRVPLTPSDIEYKLNINESDDTKDSSDQQTSPCRDESDANDDRNKEFDFATIKSAFRRSKFVPEGQNGFEDLRRYVKQGGDFCKELATILQERAEAESQYAKSLSKLSAKLSRACREGVGGLNEAWKAVAVELDARAEAHRLMGAALLEETAKPLKILTENQHRTRKQCEAAVDKSTKSLADWRATEAKGKKQSHTCARDNEKLQDAAILDNTKSGKLTLSRSTSLIQLAHMHNRNNSDKENAKLEGKKKKAEDAVKKADIEYYTLCVRAERTRLEWESAVLSGISTFQSLEEERLQNLKTVLNAYLQYGSELGPKLIEAIGKLKNPAEEAEPTKDLCTFVNLRQSSQQVSEQLLPDFYCEHITLAMNRERRKQALVKLLHLIRQDIERERKSKNGLENLSKAIKQTPNFGAEDSQQNVSEKLYHMKSMLTYLEAARYKVHNALAELDSRPRSGHPLAPHITITRDKSGLQQSILKVPQWLREEWFESDKSPVSEKSVKSDKSNKSDNSDPHNNDIADPDWTDRGAADGNSNQPDSDFDEFSSQCSSGGNICNVPEENPVQPIAQCKALYVYTPNLTDELALQPGDLLSVYRQQDDGWWLGECKGNVGIFPATYVELINTN